MKRGKLNSQATEAKPLNLDDKHNDLELLSNLLLNFHILISYFN